MCGRAILQCIDNILKQTFVADAQYFYKMTLFGKNGKKKFELKQFFYKYIYIIGEITLEKF